MDGPWEGLSAAERKRVASLSADLNATSEITSPHPPLAMTAEAHENLTRAYEARQRGDWDRVLDLLRQWGGYAPSALVSYLRGTVWSAAGDAETAAVFF